MEINEYIQQLKLEEKAALLQGWSTLEHPGGKAAGDSCHFPVRWPHRPSQAGRCR